MTSFNCELV